MHILLDWHSRSLFIHFNLIFSLLSRISVSSSLQDFPFNHILHQQTAQDTVLTKPRSPSEHCVCSRRISVDLQLPSVQSRGRLRRSQVKYFKIQDFAHQEDIGQHAQVDQELTSQEFIQATLSGDEIASHSNHEWECKKAQQKGSRMQNVSKEPSPIGP